jgi:hypothetical protein
MDRTGPKFRRILGAEAMSDEELIQGAAQLAAIRSREREQSSNDPDTFRQDSFTTNLPTTLRVGSLKELEFEVQLPKNLTGSTTLEDEDMSGSETISYADLKKQLQAVYDAETALRDSISSVTRGAGGGGSTPP